MALTRVVAQKLRHLRIAFGEVVHRGGGTVAVLVEDVAQRGNVVRNDVCDAGNDQGFLLAGRQVAQKSRAGVLQRLCRLATSPQWDQARARGCRSEPKPGLRCGCGTSLSSCTTSVEMGSSVVLLLLMAVLAL